MLDISKFGVIFGQTLGHFATEFGTCYMSGYFEIHVIIGTLPKASKSKLELF